MKEKPIRLGVVGLDGHGPVFAKEVNSSCDSLGASVVAAMPIPSVMVTPERLAANEEETRGLGVEIVHDAGELASKVDGVLILHDDGSRHLELFRDFAERGKPVFVDKPLESSLAKARELASLCREHSSPVFSGSALRFCPETVRARDDQDNGAVLSVMTHSPFILNATMPGWIYYAIHSVEQLYALMGQGCRQVRCIADDCGAVAVGTWAEGKTGIARAMKKGPHGYGLTVWREKGVHTSTVEGGTIYGGLLASIMKFVRTGISPVSIDESVEVIAFLEAANESMARDGAPVAVGG